jgi:hypothetical protein
MRATFRGKPKQEIEIRLNNEELGTSAVSDKSIYLGNLPIKRARGLFLMNHIFYIKTEIMSGAR